MSEAYRQKLLNWWCSASLWLLVSFLAFSLNWRGAQFVMALTGLENVEAFSGWIAAGFEVGIVWLPFILFWHGCDFLKRHPDSGHIPFFARYKPFSIVLVIMAPMAAIGGISGVQTGFGCGGTLLFLYQACSLPSINESLLVWLFGPILAVMCVGKAIATVGSVMEPGK